MSFSSIPNNTSCNPPAADAAKRCIALVGLKDARVRSPVESYTKDKRTTEIAISATSVPGMSTQEVVAEACCQPTVWVKKVPEELNLISERTPSVKTPPSAERQPRRT